MSKIKKNATAVLEPVVQTEPIPGKSMVSNSAGGFSFAVNDWVRLDRFLILGSEGGSYYATERSLSSDNLDAVKRCLTLDATRTIGRIVEISESGRAPKNRPAVMALALAASDLGLLALVTEAYPKVCRIPTDQFEFLERLKGQRGWGRGLRKLAARPYEDKSADDLAYYLVKYQNREVLTDAERKNQKQGEKKRPSTWSHRDALRLCHAKTTDPAKNAALRWAVGGVEALGERSVIRHGQTRSYPDVSACLPKIIEGFERVKKAQTAEDVIALIREYRLPRECVPTTFLNNPNVWEALLDKMPMTAMIRSLGKMSNVGLLSSGSQAEKIVVERLRNGELIKQSRLHPLAILVAGSIYNQGQGQKGSLTWKPTSSLKSSLDDAFYLAFGNVQPTGRPTLLALDVSGSMTCGTVAGSPLTPREASAAMALVFARVEPQCEIMAFAQTLVPVDIGPKDRLAEVIKKTGALPFGGTDCAQPMLYAKQKDRAFDSFLVFTDSETWFGKIHPCQALQNYRRHTRRPAKLVVVGMISNGFSIADPNDSGMLDVVGFDAATPQVITDFCGDHV